MTITKLISFLSIAFFLNQIATQNTTFSNANTTELAKWRDYFCGQTFLDDRRYNQSAKDYYRSLRAPIYAPNVKDAFRFYVTGSTNTWISAQRWAIGLLIVMACLAFIFWIVSLVSCCTKEEPNSDNRAMKSCVLSAWVILFLFAGLFVFIIIMMAFAEIGHRRSSCQVYSIGHFLVQGHTNEANGNNYIGLLNYRRILENVQSEASNLPLAYNHANAIINSKVDMWATGSRTALRTVYLANSSTQDTGVLAEKTQTDIYSTLTRTINPSIGQEFDRLVYTANAQVGTANAIRTMTLADSQAAVNPSINQAKIVLDQLAADIASTNVRFADRAWWRNMYNRGAYWFIFGISIIVIACVAAILCMLGKFWNSNEEVDSRFTMKVLLGIAGFFVIWYAICVIFLVVGSTSIATFCTVLANLNDGNTNAIDTLGVNWTNNPRYGLTKAALKECVTGKGDLFQFVYANPALASPWNPDVIRSLDQIIKGHVANKAWISNPRKSLGSSALTNYFNNITLTSIGVQEGAAGATDLISKLNGLTSNSNQVFSPTLAACPAYSNGQTCFAGDQSAAVASLTGFASGAQFAPHLNNLRAYIVSQSLSADELKRQLSSTNVTAQFQYTTANHLIFENQADWNQIERTTPLTIDSLNRLRRSHAIFDCRSLKVELNILEDHLCFELNFWIWIINIIAAVSLLLLFILLWVVYGAILNASPSRQVQTVPSPMFKDDPALDIDGKELIPNM